MPVYVIFIGSFLNFVAGKVGSLVTSNVHGVPVSSTAVLVLR